MDIDLHKASEKRKQEEQEAKKKKEERRAKKKQNVSTSVKTPKETIANFTEQQSIQINENTDQTAKQQIKNKHLYELDKSVKNKIHDLETLKIPTEENAIIEILDDLRFKLKNNKWKSIRLIRNNEEAKLINLLMEAYLLKYSMAIEKFEYANPNNNLTPYILDLKRFKRQKFFYKYRFIINILLTVLIFYLLDMI